MTTWEYNGDLYGECDICEVEDTECKIYAADGSVIILCKRCRQNVATYLSVQFNEGDDKT